VALPTLFNFDLDGLTECLDKPGTDLQAVFSLLSDDLTAAVPSFLGLTMTVMLDDVPVTLTTLDPHLAVSANTCVKLPLSALTPAEPGSSVVFYAAHAGAFVDLAAEVNWVGITEQVVLDGHLPSAAHPARPVGVSGLAELTEHCRAIGMLISRGRSPEEARTELLDRAERRAALTIRDGQRKAALNTAAVRRREAIVAAAALRRLLPRAARISSALGDELTTREREVLGLLVTGSGTSAIAVALVIVPATVRNHIQSILAKLGVHTRLEAVAMTVRENILATP